MISALFVYYVTLLNRFFPALLASCITVYSLNVPVMASSDTQKHWVGTWGCSPYKATTNTPPVSLSNNSLRQIVRVSIGGDTLRVKFSNSTFTKAITLKKVTIAASPDGTKSAVDASTVTKLTFNKGDSSVTINALSEVMSDPVGFNLKPGMRLAITINYGNCETSADMTFHYGSRTDSYILTGDKTTSTDFTGATTVESWYTISTIEVLAPNTTATVGIIGNSITDGYSLHGGLQNRWTDIFSEKLLNNQATKNVGVLNEGIGATNVTSAANGAEAGVSRFKHDILDQSAVRWIIIFYGVNDINANVSATNITAGLKKMVDEARAKDKTIKVYCATITPFNGHSYYSVAHEQVRQAVNQWIRNPGNSDGCIDFDKTMRNQGDTTKMQQALQTDWLHPNAAGYKAMGESIDLKMFTPPPVRVIDVAAHESIITGKISADYCSATGAITFNLPRASAVSLNVYSPLGRKIAAVPEKHLSSGVHSVKLAVGNLSHGMYFYSLSVDKSILSGTMIH